METLTPPAAASITRHTTRKGKLLLKVRIKTPGDPPSYRTYTHDPDTPLERVVARALRSVGQPSAWVWGHLDCRLPRETTPEGCGP